MSQPAQPRPDIEPALLYDLTRILEPVDSTGFLASDYGQRFRHVQGTPGKFAGLLPWPVLNRILEEHRLEPPRLRLTREGKPVPSERYLSFQQNRRKGGHAIPRIDAPALTAELRGGATLVLDAVDELHRPIRRLAESLERVFRVRVQVNAYAGWRTSHGFDLHWDDHDVFVLQVAGRKHWQIYGTTRRYPLGRDIERSADPPSEVLWDGLLEEGDLLYIPRGWWHVAMPLDEPTLHLTVGVNNLTGADLLAWFAGRMRRVEDMRRDIPHLAGADANRAFAGRLREALLGEWHPEIVDEFLSDMDAKSTPRPGFALPAAAMPEVLPQEGWKIRWSGNRSVTIGAAGDAEVFIAANGRRWRFAQAARPLLEAIVSGRDCSLPDLERVADGLDAETVRAFVRELVTNGLVVLI